MSFAEEKDQENLLLLVGDKEDLAIDQSGHQHNGHYWKTSRLLPLVITLSMITNIVLCLTLTYRKPICLEVERPSKYARLKRERKEPYVVQTPYVSDNSSLQTRLWHDLNVDAGVVALSDDWAQEHGLRTAQRFPWDISKGIYVLHGFHNLHCVKIIHMALDEYRMDLPQSRNWHHISHCVDALRRQVLCDADDTPRVTERRREVVTGIGQHRRCRSWQALEAWAKQHTACYKRPDKPDAPDAEKGLDRFKHCPNGSGYTIDDNYVPTDNVLEGLPEESIERYIE